jgi:hypothetical protein
MEKNGRGNWGITINYYRETNVNYKFTNGKKGEMGAQMPLEWMMNACKSKAN